MAIPWQVTAQELCKVALRGAGQPAPSTGMIQEAVGNQLREVLNDIKLLAPTHPLLLTNEVTVTSRGVRSVSQPTTANYVKSILLHDGPSAWRGTAQAGGNTSITLASTFSEDDDNIIGKTIFTLGGTGSLQRAYITAYNDSTKVATVHTAWTTNPSSDTTYLIADHQFEIYNTSLQVMNYDNTTFVNEGIPKHGYVQNETLWMERPPDKIYPLYWTFYIDVDQLSESGDVMKKILREWRSVLVEGVRAKSMVLYDDTRQYEHVALYNERIQRLASESIEAVQTVPYDPIFY